MCVDDKFCSCDYPGDPSSLGPEDQTVDFFVFWRTTKSLNDFKVRVVQAHNAEEALEKVRKTLHINNNALPNDVAIHVADSRYVSTYMFKVVRELVRL